MDSLGTRIRLVHSSENIRPIGSLEVQTAVDTKDYRAVIKIGEVRFGGLRNIGVDKTQDWRCHCSERLFDISKFLVFARSDFT